MIDNEKDTDIRCKYASYLKNTLKTPTDWDENLYGKFPSTENFIEKYLKFLVMQSTNAEKKKRVADFYSIKTHETEDRISQVLDEKGRAIDNFFKGKTQPRQNTLEFIAYIFESDCPTLVQFSERTKIVKTPTIASRKSRFRNYTYAVLALVTIVITFVFGSDSKNDLSKTEKCEYDSMIYASFLPRKEVGSLLFAEKETMGILNGDTTHGIVFKTINIFNNECIYPKAGQFPFATDPLGEDIGSEAYGSDYRNLVHNAFPIIKGKTTIANNNMDLKFAIKNINKYTVYIDATVLQIDTLFALKPEKLQHNFYLSKGADIHIQFKIDGVSQHYDYQTDHLPVKPNEIQYFKLKIGGNERCLGSVYRFKINVNLIDDKFKKYTIPSDKMYYIGFYR